MRRKPREPAGSGLDRDDLAGLRLGTRGRAPLHSPPGTSGAAAALGRLAKFLIGGSVDLREQMIDISGQEIMTADKVTLRLNAVLTYRIEDPLRSVTVVENARQALYRRER